MTTHMSINGSEQIGNANSPATALIEFYNGFNNRDLVVVENNWFQSEAISMSNPLGCIKHGWDEIKAVYQKIFCGPAHVFVEFYDFSIVQTDEMFCAVGHERGYFKIDNNKLELAIRTSRSYQKIKGQWKQIHHHGSIVKPDLFEKYQTAVLEN